MIYNKMTTLEKLIELNRLKQNSAKAAGELKLFIEEPYNQEYHSGNSSFVDEANHLEVILQRVFGKEQFDLQKPKEQE